MKKIGLFIFFLYSCLTLDAQDNFVIKNVHLFDGNHTFKSRNILIENGTIKKITKEKIEHKNVIDGTNKMLMPALINSHVHMWSGFQLEEAAAAGVLTVLDMHTYEPSIPILKEFRKSTQHADYYAAGGAATVPNGHGTQFNYPTPTLTKPEEAKAFVKGRIKAGADYIKIIREPWKATLNYETVAEIIKEAHHQKLISVVHVSKARDGVRVVKDKANGLVHIWDDRDLTEEEFTALKKEQFFIVPTVLTIHKVQKIYFKKSDEEQEKVTNRILKEVKRLYDAKIPILAGTDPPNAGINNGTDLYKEMIFFYKAGLSNLDILKSATSLPATHFKLKDKGFIKEGFRADFILIDGNPIQNIKDIFNEKRVWKQGKEVKL